MWRRALLATRDMNRILAVNMSKRLGIENTVAQGLVNRLEKEGYIKAPGRGKRYPFDFYITKIIKVY